MDIIVAKDGFNELLNSIKSHFFQSTIILHQARNTIKIIPFASKNYVVKSFKTPNILNRIVYTFFRNNKAKKSYEYSLAIGSFTPEPIGYRECYSFGLLTESYFVSQHFVYDFTIREPLLDARFENQMDIFKAFARFTFDLHENGILHKDYSPGNILIKKEGDGYIFKIVDVNRMEFKRLSLNERLENFKMLWAKDEYMAIIIKEYAKIVGEDEAYCIQRAIHYSQKQKDFKNMKKRLKGIEVVD